MSAEEAVSDALQTPVDQNAQAAEDAQKLLAELQNEAPPAESNGVEPDSAVKEQPEETVQGEKKSDDRNGHSDRRRDDRERRHQRGDFKGRGRGRGDRSGGRNYRDNIKSDVTTQEESSDPVAIRKQVIIVPYATPEISSANIKTFRSISTSPIPISPQTTSSGLQLEALPITRWKSKPSMSSSACATSNPSPPLSMLCESRPSSNSPTTIPRFDGRPHTKPKRKRALFNLEASTPRGLVKKFPAPNSTSKPSLPRLDLPMPFVYAVPTRSSSRAASLSNLRLRKWPNLSSLLTPNPPSKGRNCRS